MKYNIHHPLLFEMFRALDIQSQELDEYEEVVKLNKHAIGTLLCWLRNNIDHITNERWNDISDSFRFTTFTNESKTVNMSFILTNCPAKTRDILRIFLMELLKDNQNENENENFNVDDILNYTISGC